MSWSYDAEQGTTRDQVRFVIGDTNFKDQQIQDEELNFLLTANADNVMAAARGAVRHLIAKYARGVDKWVGDLKTLASQRVDHYKALLEELEKSDGFSVVYVGVPTAGGVYEGEKRVMEDRGDLVKPSFTRNQFDYGREYPKRVKP